MPSLSDSYWSDPFYYNESFMNPSFDYSYSGSSSYSLNFNSDYSLYNYTSSNTSLDSSYFPMLGSATMDSGYYSNEGSSTYSRGYGEQGHVKYSTLTSVQDYKRIIYGPLSIENKTYTGFTFGNPNGIFGSTYTFDSGSSWSIRTPYNGEVGVSYLGVSIQLPGTNTSYELNLVGPSLTVSSTGSSQTNSSLLIQNSTSYSLSPFVDEVRHGLSTYRNPYNTKFGPLPWYQYALP